MVDFGEQDMSMAILEMSSSQETAVRYGSDSSGHAKKDHPLVDGDTPKVVYMHA